MTKSTMRPLEIEITTQNSFKTFMCAVFPQVGVCICENMVMQYENMGITLSFIQSSMSLKHFNEHYSSVLIFSYTSS